MADWTAPAKLNLSLVVRPRDASGYHPLRSLVQTIDWVDVLSVEEGAEDRLVVRGADLPEGGENLVWRAVGELERAASGRPGRRRPPLDLALDKRIPVGAGLAGGSSDAAAVLLALIRMLRWPRRLAAAAAARVGADVPYLLTGGTAWMEGRGERITPLPALTGFAVAVVVPPFELATPEVYRRWDDLGGPAGPEMGVRRLPPALREAGPVRNDLLGAALDLRPDLGDWMRDLGEAWERPAAMSGSGPSLFAFFADLDEAEGALGAVPGNPRAARAAALRPHGAQPGPR